MNLNSLFSNIATNVRVLCEVFRNGTKTSIGLKTKDYKYKTNININLKPKIIAKKLLANRLLIIYKMSIDEQKILIAKYLGLITETDGLWYLDNTHELKYDEDWNWIISAYKQIKNIEFEKIGTTDRIGDILRGIFNADIHQSFSSIYEYVNRQTQAVC